VAIVTVGDGVADFDTRGAIAFPSITLQGGRGYYFFVDSVPSVALPSLQYVSMFARYVSGGVEIETRLLAKFFPNGARMMFIVPVPDFSFFPASYSVSILGRPKEFYRGAGSVRSFPVRLFRDDSKFIGSLSVVP
jgi:hypothetical protein